MFKDENWFALVVSGAIAIGAFIGWSLAFAQMPPGLTGKHVEIPMVCGPSHLAEKFLELDHGEVPMVAMKSAHGQSVGTLYSDPLFTSSSIGIWNAETDELCFIWGTKCNAGECFMPTGAWVFQ